MKYHLHIENYIKHYRIKWLQTQTILQLLEDTLIIIFLNKYSAVGLSVWWKFLRNAGGSILAPFKCFLKLADLIYSSEHCKAAMFLHLITFPVLLVFSDFVIKPNDPVLFVAAYQTSVFIISTSEFPSYTRGQTAGRKEILYLQVVRFSLLPVQDLWIVLIRAFCQQTAGYAFLFPSNWIFH